MKAGTTRRRFLTTTGAWAAGFTLAHPLLAASGRTIPLTATTGRTRPRDWIPDPAAPEQLRALASQALEAAQHAGASFADIRIGEQRGFGVDTNNRIPRVGWHVGYGIRVLVDGTWGFVHGQLLTADGVTEAARNATGVAKSYAAVNASVQGEPVKLAPVPVVHGEWTSPCRISPFDIPIDDHLRDMLSLEQSAASVPGVNCSCSFEWAMGTRIFASTDGSLVTQHLTRSGRRFIEVVTESPLLTIMSVPGLGPVASGYESVQAPDLPERILETAAEVVRRSEVPLVPFEDEGRFPVVFDGDAMVVMVGSSLGCLLDGERVAGFEADASGTTYLKPPEKVLNLPEGPFSSLVTLTADRAVPSYTAVQWDDEGVVPSPTTLIDHGHIRRYLVTRETAGINPDHQLSGCMTAPSEDEMPLMGGTHLTLAPAPDHASLASLVKTVTHGFLVRAGTTGLEPGLTTGTSSGEIYEIKHGEEVARVPNLVMAFQTRAWWKDQLHALGDVSTMRTDLVDNDKGMPWENVSMMMTAPAAFFNNVNVSRTDIKLS